MQITSVEVSSPRLNSAAGSVYQKISGAFVNPYNAFPGFHLRITA